MIKRLPFAIRIFSLMGAIAGVMGYKLLDFPYYLVMWFPICVGFALFYGTEDTKRIGQ